MSIAARRLQRVSTVGVSDDGSWTPSELGFIARPTGANYIRLEDIPGVGTNLRQAAVHSAAHNKVITLPAGTFELNDFVQGDGNKWMHGLMVNPSTSTYYCRGFVGSGAGTVIQMVPNSSHFTMENGSTPTENTTQFSQSTILFYNVNNVEFGNLVVQGQQQPHYHHGIRINGNGAHVHHCKFMGAGLGDYNMPPAETYSLAVGGIGSLVEDCEFDGRRTVGGTPVSSTVIGALNATNLMLRRIYCHDLVSGFGVVQWEGTGMTTEDMWVVRPGTGTSGWNGAHTNHEKGAGPIRHIRPHIILDGWWGPADGRPRRNNSKFPHFIFLRPDNSEDYVDVEIIDPVFDTWGGLNHPTTNTNGLGGFALMLDDSTSPNAMDVSVKPKVRINGVWLTGVVRPKWWEDKPTPFNPTTQYWITPNSGDGSVWG